MMKKVTTLLLASTMILHAIPAHAVEPCSFSHTMNFKNEPVYDQLKYLTQIEIHLMFETNSLLFRRAKSGEPIFELVKSVTFDDANQTLHIKMRENCGWSDGTLITAHDVVKGLEDVFLAGDDLYVPGRNFFKGGIEVAIDKNVELGIKAVSDTEIEIESLTGYDLIEQALTRINFSPYPLHLSAEEQYEWRKGHLSRLSSGAFQVSQLNDDEIQMRRNPYFCSDIQPEIETITVINSPLLASQLGLFQNEKVNVIERFASRDLYALLSRVDAKKSVKFKIREMNDEIMEYLIERKGSKLEAYPHLRPSLMMAIDTQNLSEIIQNSGTETQNSASISFPYEGYEKPNDPMLKMDYSDRVEISKKIMEESGFNDENQLKLTLEVRNDFNDSQVANAIAAMWSQIHIDTKIVSKNNKLMTSENPVHIDYTVLILGSDYSDPSDFLNTIVGFANFTDPNKIRNQIEKSFDIQNQKDRWKELSNIDLSMLEQRVVLPIDAQKTPWILSEELELKDYFNLYASNLTSTTCPAQ